MTKVMMKLLWEVVGVDLAKMLRFRSSKALASCMQANDHHKAWQMVEIFLYGIGDELLVPFVKQCIVKAAQPTAEGYFEWTNTITDPNYRFLLEATFTYLLALFLFRTGVRRNNSEVMLASRIKFSPLFYGFNKTNYQLIDFRDMKTRACAPTPIKKFITENESFTMTGHPSKGEGCDFILEGRNKASKMWMPSGVPTESQWVKVCRNIDRLEQIRENLQEVIGLNRETNPNVTKVNLEKEIYNWRRALQISEYLSHPQIPRPHCTLSGAPLDDDLINFSATCKFHRNNFLKHLESTTKIQNIRNLQPIFILVTDRQKFQKLENKTKSELENMIRKTLLEIQEKEPAVWEDVNQKWNREVKIGKKQCFIDFYKDITLLLESMQENEDLDRQNAEEDM